MKYSLLAALTLAAGLASADDVVQTTSLTVQDDLATIELINVTADKPQDPRATAETDADVVAILEAAEQAED